LSGATLHKTGAGDQVILAGAARPIVAHESDCGAGRRQGRQGRFRVWSERRL